MPIERFPLGPLGTNSYIISKDRNAVAIDVGGEPQDMLAYLHERNLVLAAICLTHMHFDHLYGVADLASATGAPVYAPEGDNALMETESGRGGIWGLPKVPEFGSMPLKTGKTELGGMECIVLETPGHTPGGVSFYFPQENAVFTGDALFYRSIGRTDFPMGDHQQLLSSVKQKLLTLPANVVVYPGHGPETTIGAEKKENPFVGDFAG